MLLANRNVAEMIGKRKEKLPFIYRIHDEPDPDKLDSLREFVKRFGYTFDLENSHQRARRIIARDKKQLKRLESYYA